MVKTGKALFFTNMIGNHGPQYSAINSSVLTIKLLGIQPMSFNYTYYIYETYVLINNNSRVL